MMLNQSFEGTMSLNENIKEFKPEFDQQDDY